MEQFSVRQKACAYAAAFAVLCVACGGSTPTGVGGGSGGGTGGGGGSAPANQVTVSNDVFTPQNLTVAPSATVTWIWNSGGITHNVTFASSAIASSGDRNGGSFSAAMPAALGTYNYQCTIHGGMTGAVVVQQ